MSASSRLEKPRSMPPQQVRVLLDAKIEVLYRGLRAVALTKDSLQSPLSLSAATLT